MVRQSLQRVSLGNARPHADPHITLSGDPGHISAFVLSVNCEEPAASERFPSWTPAPNSLWACWNVSETFLRVLSDDVPLPGFNGPGRSGRHYASETLCVANEIGP